MSRVRKTFAAVCVLVVAATTTACQGGGEQQGPPSEASSAQASRTASSGGSATPDTQRTVRVPSGETPTPVVPISRRPSASASVPDSGAPSQTCVQMARSLPRDRQIGQLFMVANTGGEVNEMVRRAVANRKVGSVMYLGEVSGSKDQIARTSATLRGLDPQLPVLVSVDHEGGTVQRLRGPGFTQVPSARNQAKVSAAELTAKWQGWGAELKQAGIDMNLAPVADVVPSQLAGRNRPIAGLGRGYGSDEKSVGTKAAAVAAGLRRAGVLTSVKHFPGIGRVVENTDHGRATDTTTTADDVASFRTVIDAGVDSVMVSSVVYTRIDPDQEAMFSPKVITGLLREKLGWQGVVVSDDMGAAGAVSHMEAGARATNFITAGGDLIITVDTAGVGKMTEALARLAELDPSFAEELPTHTARVLELKQKAGLLTCKA